MGNAHAETQDASLSAKLASLTTDPEQWRSWARWLPLTGPPPTLLTLLPQLATLLCSVGRMPSATPHSFAFILVPDEVAGGRHL